MTRVVRKNGWSIATCACGWQGRGHKTARGGSGAASDDAHAHKVKAHKAVNA